MKLFGLIPSSLLMAALSAKSFNLTVSLCCRFAQNDSLTCDNGDVIIMFVVLIFKLRYALFMLCCDTFDVIQGVIMYFITLKIIFIVI